jgi:DNA-binding GntR family transcriptional regulator
MTRPTKAKQIHQAIADDIVHGRLSPGAPLDETSIAATFERLVSAGNREAYVEFNNRFHEAIYRGAHNSFLVELAITVRKRCAPFRRAQFETLGRLAKSHAEHGTVVTAVQRGDAQLAATEMRAHIVVVRNAVDEVAGDALRRGEEIARNGPPTATAQLRSNRALPDIA